MKHLVAAMLLFHYSFALGQDNAGKHLFETNSKMHLYYVDLNHTDGKVFGMGSYLDKAGSGYSIRMTDTLTRHAGGTYAGSKTKVITENNQLYLVTDHKKARKLLLAPVKNADIAHHNLNNAYYLGHYFKMSDELNSRYPLNHHSFRNGFLSWKELPNKDMDYVQFRDSVHKRIKQIKDSISQQQEYYVAVTHYIIQHLKDVDYLTLKDSLVRLPGEFGSFSRYYGVVINEVAKQRPDYFFRLAEDFPHNRSLIFSSVEDNKEVLAGLKAVQGHDQIQKEFFKERRFDKTFPYRIIGTYAIAAGLIIFLIAL